MSKKPNPETLPVLYEFEEKPVVAITAALVRAGDGLSQAMAIDPVKIEQGQVVYVLTEAKCEDVRHPLFADQGQFLERKQVLVAQTMTLISEDVARKHIAKQKKLNLEAELARQEADGKPGMLDADGQVKSNLADRDVDTQ